MANKSDLATDQKGVPQGRQSYEAVDNSYLRSGPSTEEIRDGRASAAVPRSAHPLTKGGAYFGPLLSRALFCRRLHSSPIMNRCLRLPGNGMLSTTIVISAHSVCQYHKLQS
eukprot:450075-Pleurochrysis_carterae.AAC.5